MYETCRRAGWIMALRAVVDVAILLFSIPILLVLDVSAWLYYTYIIGMVLEAFEPLVRRNMFFLLTTSLAVPVGATGAVVFMVELSRAKASISSVICVPYGIASIVMTLLAYLYYRCTILKILESFENGDANAQ